MSAPHVLPGPDLLAAFESMFGPIDWDAAADRARREYVDIDPDTTPEYGSDADADRAAAREQAARWEA